MDLRQIVILALQVSILCTVLGFGLNATSADLRYLIGRPGLLVRSLLAMFVIMPVLAVILVRMFDFPRLVEMELVALAISPVPPLLPKKQTKAGGSGSYGLALMVILALVSIVSIPATLELLERFSGRPLAMAPGAVAGVVMKAIILPVAAGMAVRAVLPAIAERLEKVVTLIGMVLLPLAAVVLLFGARSVLWALVGEGTLLAMLIFIVAGTVIGHVLGGPERNHSTVLALSTGCRHPAMALAILSTNFPDLRFGGLILLYIVATAIIGIPYVTWQRRQTLAAIRTT